MAGAGAGGFTSAIKTGGGTGGVTGATVTGAKRLTTGGIGGGTTGTGLYAIGGATGSNGTVKSKLAGRSFGNGGARRGAALVLVGGAGKTFGATATGTARKIVGLITR